MLLKVTEDTMTMMNNGSIMQRDICEYPQPVSANMKKIKVCVTFVHGGGDMEYITYLQTITDNHILMRYPKYVFSGLFHSTFI